MVFRSFLFLTFVGATLMSSAQTTVTGVVTDADTGSPLQGASARIVDANGKIKRFANSNGDGVFRIAFPAGSDSLALHVAKMGFATAEFSVNALDFSDTLRVRLYSRAVQLREVGVRASRIRENGDTVIYNVGQFARKQDTSIGEVMNRMPGLEVDESGKVQYQGNDINKLYVEGTDLAGGKYGTITKGVAAENVKSVEVLENHQPMQVLRGLSFSDQAAVNLRLKDKVKASVMAHGTAGGGYGERAGGLYSGELFLMTVKGVVQNVTSLSLNDFGRVLGGMSGGLFGNDDAGEKIDAYTSIGRVGGNGNSTFGRSAMLSTSTVFKSRQGGEWRLQADYGYNHLWADRSNSTTYYLETGDRVVVENRHSDERSHIASLSANYEINQKKYFLSNSLVANLSWSDTQLGIMGTLPNSQNLSAPNHEIVNRLKVIRRFGERHIVTFNSVNQWMLRPEHLRVEVAGSTSGADSDYGSDVRQQAFFTDERASYGFIIGRVIATAEAGVSGFFRHLDSDITGNPGIDMTDATNDISTDYFRVFVRPKFELNIRRFSLSLSVPVNYYHYRFGGVIPGRNEFFTAPNISAQWKMNSRNTFNATASLNRSPADLHNILRGDVLSDYRTFNAGADDYYTSTGQSVSLRWEWRNPRRGWFANASVFQTWSDSRQGMAQNIVGDYVINSFVSQPSSSESTSVYYRISRSFDDIGATISFGGMANRGSGTVFSQGERVDRSYAGVNVSPTLDIRICSWLNGYYTFTFRRDKMRIFGDIASRIDGYTHCFSLSATPGNWRFTVNGSHRRDMVQPHVYQNWLDLDARAAYKLSKRVELSINATNLLDRREYALSSINGLTSSESVSYLRGREVIFSIRITK